MKKNKKNPKILIIRPRNINNKYEYSNNGFNCKNLPVYALQLAGFFIKNNYNVDMMDLSVNYNTFILDMQKIKDAKYDYIYIPTKILCTESMLLYIQYLRNILNIKVPIIISNEYLNICESIKNIIEGIILSDKYSNTFISLSLLSSIDIIKGEDINNISNILYCKNGEVIYNKINEGILDENYESYSIYAYKIIDDNIRNNLYNEFNIFTYNICNHNCSFCQMSKCNNNNINKFDIPINSILEEISFLKNEYGITKNYFFEDPIFYTQKNDMFEILNKIKKLSIKWHCFMRIGYIRENMIKKLFDSGLVNLIYGIETFNDELLNFLNKAVTTENIIKEMEILVHNGVSECSQFEMMLGIPGESNQTILNSYNFVKKMNPSNVHWNILTPFPGTLLYDYCDKNNLLLHKNWDLYDSDHQIIKLDNFKDYKIEKIRDLLKKGLI